MKIASAELQMASAHASFQHREVKESLRMWVGDRRPDFEGRGRENRPPQAAAPERVTISDAGRAAAADDINEDIADAVNGDSRMILIRSMLEALTGQKIRIFNAQDLQADRKSPDIQPPATSGQANGNQPAGFGIEYDYSEHYVERQETRFAASGFVRTEDGREIGFQIALSMSYAYEETRSISLRLGDAARQIDPLVLNFAGNAAQLQDQRFAFDLDADGQTEQIARLASGSAYLVFDRNQDGRINDGREMFGPTRGDGFAELAELDDDANGWIDENDAAFQQLKLWNPDENGQGRLYSLAEMGVGAIALSRIATPFDLKNNANQLLGQIRSSGIFLQENGTAGTIQQIDLTA